MFESGVPGQMNASSIPLLQCRPDQLRPVEPGRDAELDEGGGKRWPSGGASSIHRAAPGREVQPLLNGEAGADFRVAITTAK